MKISIVMATYNGQNFIKKQLESLNNQSVPIDELLIRDDGSSDNTVEIIKEYINQNNLSSWKLTVNSNNLGWRNNFSELLRDATGDLIFLSDQDDYWYPDKVEHMSAVFEEHNNIEVLVSDCSQNILEGAKGHTFNSIFETPIQTNLFQVKQSMKNYTVGRPGWTYVISKKFVPYFLKVRKDLENKGHDVLIWQLSLARNSLFHLHLVTGIWTMHPKSAIAVERDKNNLNSEQLIRYFNDEIHMVNAMLKECQNTNFESNLRRLKINYFARIEVLNKKKISCWAYNLLNYNSFKSVVGDLRRIIR